MDLVTLALARKYSKSQIGKPGGAASLDDTGKVPSEQLPSYIDDVIEYDSRDEFPDEGEKGKIYVDTETGFTYRWSGSEYVQIGGGESDSLKAAAIAPVYDEEKTYYYNDIVTYNNKLYIVEDALGPQGGPEEDGWRELNVIDIITQKDIENIAPIWNNYSIYEVGDYCYYNEKYYICQKAPTSVPSIFNTENWKEIGNSYIDVINYLITLKENPLAIIVKTIENDTINFTTDEAEAIEKNEVNSIYLSDLKLGFYKEKEEEGYTYFTTLDCKKSIKFYIVSMVHQDTGEEKYVISDVQIIDNNIEFGISSLFGEENPDASLGNNGDLYSKVEYGENIVTVYEPPSPVNNPTIEIPNLDDYDYILVTSNVGTMEQFDDYPVKISDIPEYPKEKIYGDFYSGVSRESNKLRFAGRNWQNVTMTRVKVAKSDAINKISEISQKLNGDWLGLPINSCLYGNLEPDDSLGKNKDVYFQLNYVEEVDRFIDNPTGNVVFQTLSYTKPFYDFIHVVVDTDEHHVDITIPKDDIPKNKNVSERYYIYRGNESYGSIYIWYYLGAYYIVCEQSYSNPASVVFSTIEGINLSSPDSIKSIYQKIDNSWVKFNGGIKNYDELENKPSINGKILEGNIEINKNYYDNTDPDNTLGNDGDLYSKVEYGTSEITYIDVREKPSSEWTTYIRLGDELSIDIDDFDSVSSITFDVGNTVGFNEHNVFTNAQISRDVNSPSKIYDSCVDFYYNTNSKKLIFTMNSRIVNPEVKCIFKYVHWTSNSAVTKIDSVKQKLKGAWIDLPSGGESGGSSNHYGDTEPTIDLGNEGDLYSKVEYGDVAFEIVKYEDRLNYKFGRNATAVRVKIENIDEYYNVYAYCGSADDWGGYDSEISIAGTDISRDSANPTRMPNGVNWRWMYYDETTSELVFNQNANYGTGCIKSLIIYSHSAIKQIDSVKQKLKGNWIDIPSGGEVEVGTRMQNAKDLFVRVMDNGLIPIDSPVAQTFPKTSTDRVNVDGTFNLSNGAEGFINICKIPTYNLGMIEGSITVTSVDAGGYIAFGLIGDGVPESASDIPWVLKGQEMNTTGTYSFYVEDSMDIYEQPKPVGEYRFIVYGKSIRATVNYKEFTMDITDGEPFVRDFTVVTEDRDFIKTPITREKKISQADFDALSDEEKNNGTRYYISNSDLIDGNEVKF